MISVSKKINLLIPISFSLIISLLWFFFSFVVFKTNKSSFSGLYEVLGSVINFSSIVIGFYTAMYGIIISFMQSDKHNIFKEINTKKNLADTFKFQLQISLVISFISLIVSIILQAKLVSNISLIGYILFYIWLFFTIMLFTVSGITMLFLIRLIFAKEQNERESIGIKKGP